MSCVESLLVIGTGSAGCRHTLNAAAAGVPDVRVHDLRHTAASLWLAAGADPKVVQRVLGHATAAMTMDLYGHLVDASLWQAARLIGGTTGASERLQGRIRTESEPGPDAKNLKSRAFTLEPPIGIEPMTYALREAREGALRARAALTAAPSRSRCPECTNSH